MVRSLLWSGGANPTGLETFESATASAGPCSRSAKMIEANMLETAMQVSVSSILDLGNERVLPKLHALFHRLGWSSEPGAKYRGRLVSDLVSEDPGYCQWLLRAAEETYKFKLGGPISATGLQMHLRMQYPSWGLGLVRFLCNRSLAIMNPRGKRK